jgi:hypothetical protein
MRNACDFAGLDHEWKDAEECPSECGDDRCMVACKHCDYKAIACEE